MPTLNQVGGNFTSTGGGGGGGGPIGGSASNIPLTPQNIVRVLRWFGGKRDTENLIPGVSFPGYSPDGTPIDGEDPWQYADFSIPDDASLQQFMNNYLSTNPGQGGVTSLNALLLALQQAGLLGAQIIGGTNTGGSTGNTGNTGGTGNPGTGGAGGGAGGNSGGGFSGTEFFEKYIKPYLPLFAQGALEVIGARSAASGAKEAAEIQAGAANKALQLEGSMYNQNRSDMYPWLETGTKSLYRLGDLMGLKPSPRVMPSRQGINLDTIGLQPPEEQPNPNPQRFDLDAMASKYRRVNANA